MKSSITVENLLSSKNKIDRHSDTGMTFLPLQCISFLELDLAGQEGSKRKTFKTYSMQLEGGFGGIRFLHVKGFDSLSFKD
jgi:hypothetical protein